METISVAPSAPRLRRSLTLWDLILYGVIVIQPVAPMSVFGVLSDRGRGHVVTTILIAMVAMLFTAISYGKMARAYPSAGSAFTYVGQEINPALGYVTGWSMVMFYSSEHPGSENIGARKHGTGSGHGRGDCIVFSGRGTLHFWESSQRSGLLHASFLRSGFVECESCAGRHLDRGAHLYWV